jgi:glycosyltransferase involved in cell wall biosynthesis
MSSGLHVLLYAVGGLVEAVADYPGAVIVPSEDVDALREALLAVAPRRAERFANPHSWTATVEAIDGLAQALDPAVA